MKRKVILVVALFALMAVGVYAQTEADFDTKTSSDGKSIWITGYKGKATAVNIPAKIKNLPVIVIDHDSFGYEDITSVVIPNGVTEIGMAAFSNCEKLTSVTIPNSVSAIWDNAFQSCIKLTSITIPASVTTIGRTAFSGCTNLTSVTFAGSIPSSSFEANAFGSAAKGGDIRDKYLAANGGAGTYTRPAGGTTWTKSASTTAAPTAAGTPGLAFALTKDGKGYSVSKGTVASGNVVIPASYNNLPVTEIANMAFDKVPGINSVIIPNSVTRIGQAAFQACIYLTSVTLGSGVNAIDMKAFTGCQNLTSVTFQSTIPALSFHDMSEFPGDLCAKYLAAGGGIGTYTRPDGKSTTWTKK
jgi:hypothetical protein